MKLDDLWFKYQGKQFVGYGLYKVTFVYRGKTISCTTTNTLAIDRLSEISTVTSKTCTSYYTEKQALQALYDECKWKNGID